MAASDEANQWIGVDFRDRDLRGRDFSHESLQYADFRGADLRNCKFQNANLSDTNFQGAKIGIDNAEFFQFLIDGTKAAFPLLLVLSLAILLSPSSLFSDNSENTSSQSSTNEQILHPIHDTLLPITAAILFLGLGFAGVGIYFLLTHNINRDSVGYVDAWIGITSSVSVVALIAMIWIAGSLTQTDFSGAILSRAKLDRSSFRKAKSAGVEVDRINWQD
jgi:uncharacterized protein YjbI with pentapeptide repeats